MHGVVKLASGFCLLRRISRGYPWAIGALCALLAYQVADAAATGSITMTALAVIDAAIIVIVIAEYRHLRATRLDQAVRGALADRRDRVGEAHLVIRPLMCGAQPPGSGRLTRSASGRSR